MISFHLLATLCNCENALGDRHPNARPQASGQNLCCCDNPRETAEGQRGTLKWPS